MSIKEKLEDLEAVKGVISEIYEAVTHNTGMPGTIPVCNDLTLTDQLSEICECITVLRMSSL